MSAPPPPDTPWLPHLPPARVPVLLGSHIHLVLPQPRQGLYSDLSAYTRVYTPYHAISAQNYARSFLSCHSCGGTHFTHECTQTYQPFDSMLYQSEATHFWSTCERLSSYHRAAHRIPPLRPAQPDPPPAPPGPVAPPTQRAHTAASSSNRFAPLSTLDANEFLDNPPSSPPPLPVVQAAAAPEVSPPA